MASADPGPSLTEHMMVYQETFVQRNQHRIYVREYPGEEPPIILMHGFPDNIHLYDRLLPFLPPPRRVVCFDFLGWGRSDKPLGYPYTASNQVGDLDAVITQLRLQQVILVAHDASGPPAIDWAIDQPDRVAGLVLLNTYYCAMPTLRPPEAIWLFSTPGVRSIARPVSQLFGHWIFRRMYQWQVGRFFRDAEVRDKFLPLLYQQFDATPSARAAFFRLNEDLVPTIRSRTEALPKLRAFTRPVRIIFGDADPYLNKSVAQRFHEIFPASELFLVPGARHFVQMDEPAHVARLILAMPAIGSEQADNRPRDKGLQPTASPPTPPAFARVPPDATHGAQIPHRPTERTTSSAHACQLCAIPRYTESTCQQQ